MHTPQLYFAAAAIAIAQLLYAAPLFSQSGSVCIDCHLATEDPHLADPVKLFTEHEDGRPVDIHARAGFSCHHCHGGNHQDELTSKSRQYGYRGIPSTADIPALCGECHSNIEYMRQYNPRLPTDQLRLYRTSYHGKLLSEGDLHVATCASCHGAHGIRRSGDPRSPVFPTNIPERCGSCHADATYMASYPIPTNQLDAFRRSEHGRRIFEEGDITAPTCNTCHGNHGAVPPNVAAVHHVCGQCHAQHDEYFVMSTHHEIFQMMDMPGCVTCHGYHEIPAPSENMLSNEPGSVCMTCHMPDDPCFQYVDTVRGMFDDLKSSLQRTESLLKEAEQLGMGVAPAQFSLTEVRDHLIRARIKIHQFESGPVEEELTEAMTIVETAHQAGVAALDEWQFRRIGLGISLVFIVILIVALAMKIRSMEHSAEDPR